MPGRRVDVFFYGLFMDRDTLAERGVDASSPRRAQLKGYALFIGGRATLVPTPGARAYGMVYALTHEELERLYTAPGLEPYRPEAILVRSMEGDVLPALCYNLAEAPPPGEANAEYAARLRAVLRKLQFPRAYIESVS